MEINYWEKQLILYTKRHYGRVNYKEDLKHFPAKLYGIPLDSVKQYHEKGMVVRLYNGLVSEGHLKFELEDFIDNIFHRSVRERDSTEVSYYEVLGELLADIQNLTIGGTELDLGDVDTDLHAVIQEKITAHDETKPKLKLGRR